MNQQGAKQIDKKFHAKIAPQAANAWQEKRDRKHIRHFEQRLGLPELTRNFIEQHGRCVLSGPFANMVYVPQATGSALMPKLVGSYEAELHGTLEKIAATDYLTIIDVGCAEGYYAIGLAMRLPNARIYAFDIDPEARELCTAMARLNGVEKRVTVSGKCGPDDLNRLLTEKSLIVCDCEGFESELLRPDLVPAMAQADILVELHDHVQPGLTPLLLSRFQETHAATMLTAVERDHTCYPQIRFTDTKSRQLAVSEFRPCGQRWAFFQSVFFQPTGPAS